MLANIEFLRNELPQQTHVCPMASAMLPLPSAPDRKDSSLHDEGDSGGFPIVGKLDKSSTFADSSASFKESAVSFVANFSGLLDSATENPLSGGLA